MLIGDVTMRLQLRESRFCDFEVWDIDAGVVMISMKFEPLAFSAEHQRIIAEGLMKGIASIPNAKSNRKTPDIVTLKLPS